MLKAYKIGVPFVGMQIQKCFGGHPEPFDKQITEQLAKAVATVTPEKVDGNRGIYGLHPICKEKKMMWHHRGTRLLKPMDFNNE